MPSFGRTLQPLSRISNVAFASSSIGGRLMRSIGPDALALVCLTTCVFLGCGQGAERGGVAERQGSRNLTSACSVTWPTVGPATGSAVQIQAQCAAGAGHNIVGIHVYVDDLDKWSQTYNQNTVDIARSSPCRRALTTWWCKRGTIRPPRTSTRRPCPSRWWPAVVRSPLPRMAPPSPHPSPSPPPVPPPRVTTSSAFTSMWTAMTPGRAPTMPTRSRFRLP